MKQKITNHEAVEELYKDLDGWWIVLKDGYNYEGCVSIHEPTLTRLADKLSCIKIGNPY
jgi:hypothetical protein